MITRANASISTFLVAALVLIGQQASTQPIYKWVDENGVVHYGQSVPQGVEQAEQINVAPSRAAPTPTPSQASERRSSASARSQAARPERPGASSTATQRQPSEMSLEELDQLCEEAREAAIAPLRTAAIAECKAQRRTDPAYCERFYATYGDAVTIRPGVARPRMFNDLPACVLAQEERRRRAR